VGEKRTFCPVSTKNIVQQQMHIDGKAFPNAAAAMKHMHTIAQKCEHKLRRHM
jgi:hypothetical protein